MNERTIGLIGQANLNKIQQKNILIVGVGGVGGTALEALIRSGIKKITIIDNDTFEKSNLNRQILATTKTLSSEKTKIAQDRIKKITPEVEVISHQIFLTKENMNVLDNYDYIIDACDTIDTKISLIEYANKKGIKIISCMGTGKRLDPSKVRISTLKKTYNDPLAKIMRKRIKDLGIDTNIPVVFSEELPMNNEKTISSMVFVPWTAGLYLANFVINDIIKE